MGFVTDGHPVVLPTIHARVGERLYVHGAAASRMLRVLEAGAPACVTVTLLDGLVLARSAFHHSMNYRSVVLFGTAAAVSDPSEKRMALSAIVEHVLPHRLSAVRAPSDQELQATRVLSFPITEASAKVRTGPPVDSDSDYSAECWAGVIPLHLATGEPEPCPRLRPGMAAPRIPARRGG